MTRVLAALPPREYATLMLLTAVICAGLGFAAAAFTIAYGPWQGTGTAGAVTDVWGARGDP